MSADWVQAWAAVAAAGIGTFGVLAVGVTYFIQVRPQLVSDEKTREGHLLSDVSRRWDEGKLFEARVLTLPFGNDSTRFANHLSGLRTSNVEEYLTLRSLPDFFEGLGILEETKGLDIYMVECMFGSTLTKFWLLYQDYILSLRKSGGHDEIYFHFSSLADKLEARLNKRKP